MRIALLSLAVAAACSHDVVAHFPAAPDEPTGTLVLLMSQPATGVTISINGVLVVEDEHTGRIVIDHVPVGTDEVVMAANGADKEFKAWIGGDHATTVPLGFPDPGAGFVKSLFGTLLTIVVYSMLHH